jgi:hypothetical protein
MYGTSRAIIGFDKWVLEAVGKMAGAPRLEGKLRWQD